MTNFNIQNGDLAKDTITDFEGIVTATAQYIAGCDQILLTEQGTKKKPGSDKSRWFDIERLELIKKSKVKIKARPTGGPANASEMAPTR